MANTVIALKKSATPSAAPLANQLANGELAINYADGILFYKAANGSIASIQSLEGNSFGTVNANNTLVVADTVGDVLSIVSGTNISIIGDAINDKITIGLTNDVVIPGSGSLKVAATGGDEGGKIKLANAITNSVLVNDIVIDVYQNRLRFFESGGTNRGAFINLASAATGVGTDLLSPTGAIDTTARDWATAAFARANTANITADRAWNHANAAFITANIAFSNANTVMVSAQAAFTVANSGFLHANSGYAFANSIAITANLAFAHANSAYANGNVVIQTAQSAFTQANLAFVHANNAFARANIANITADRAWNHANAAFANANTVMVSAQSAFTVANAAFLHANAVYAYANADYAFSNSAHSIANLAFTHANAAFAKANAALPSSSYTASDVLSKLLTVDGAGSGLDADLLDGQHGSYYGIATDVTAANRVANAAFLHANASYAFSNSAHSIANLAFTHANNAYSTANGRVSSVSGTGTVSGITLTGTVTTTGSLTLGGTLSASIIDNMSDEHRLFNNMGDNHSTRTSFDATSPSYNFGWRFVQGSTNGPGVNGAAQYYSEYVGLGNDYLATGAGSYGMQIAYPRNVTEPYVAIRYNENNTLGAWQKISAGNSDKLNSQAATYYGIATDVTAANRVANAAFLHANASYAFSNSAHSISNLAFTHANGAFAKANAALPSSSYTASDVLSKLLTVDGAGSGLDADLLDGISSASFMRTDVASTHTTGKYTVYTPSGAVGTVSGTDNLEVFQPNAGADAFLTFHIGGDYAANFGIDGTTNDLFYGGWSAGANKFKVWHAGNDGTSSGLDADLLDGQQGTYYGIATDVTAANRVANAAFLHANASFIQANTGRDHANASFIQANTARDHANAAFLKANTGGGGGAAIPILIETTNANRYIVFESDTSGNLTNANVSTALTFNPSTGTLSSTLFNSTSDEIFKYDIAPIENALAYVENMNGVKFKWKNTDKPSIGVIAQEIEKILPELVDTVEDHKTVNYNGIIAVLIEAIKELRLEVEDLKYKYRTEVENK